METDQTKEASDTSSKPNLYLVGFMGTGKSVVGNKVASLLNFPFVDSDKAIESQEGLRIPEIFEEFGESHFRKLESEFIKENRPAGSTVISCGGGLVTNPELLKIMQETGVVVVLWASMETLMQRISGDANRPLMKTDNPRERIENLLKEREKIYMKAGVGIMTDGHTIGEVAEHIKRIYLEKR